MYADDAVIFTHDKNYLEIASTLTSAMVHIDDWLTRSCLYLNSKKKNSLYGVHQKMYEGVTF